MFWKILQNSQENTCEFCEIFKNIFFTKPFQEPLYKSLVYNANKCQKLWFVISMFWLDFHVFINAFVRQKCFSVIKVLEWLSHLNVSLTV